MVGALFTISPINVARAAIRKVERVVSADAPIAILVRSYRAADDHDDRDGFSRLYIAVTGEAGPTHEIAVDDLAVRACLDDGADVDDLIDRLAEEIKTAARAVLAP